ncbi:MAG: VWA domain-containing protein, partial [Actinomycetota bacterium]|nr:VWA domain-containing protein [Actinomycetota bacterium]
PLRLYFFTGAFGYGVRVSDGREGVEPIFGGQLAGRGIVPLPEVAVNPLALRQESMVDAVATRPRMPVWIEAAHGYRTPMCEAISVAGEHAYQWTQQFPNSFPPIVINITDGMVTDSPFGDADLTTWASRLTGVATNDGPALLLNVFLSSSQERPIWFPESPYGLPDPGPSLFSISSPLPAPMIENAQSQGVGVSPGARGLAFNADLAMLIKFLEIGTRVDVRDH